MKNLFKKSILPGTFMLASEKDNWDKLSSQLTQVTKKSISSLAISSIGDKKIGSSEQVFLYPSITHLASYINKNPKSKIKLVDFGGGEGKLYSYIKELFPNSNIDCTIVEQDFIVEKYSKLESPIKFSTVDNLESECDVLSMIGVLQYIKNPEETIINLINKLNPKLIIIDRTFFMFKSNTKTFGKQYMDKAIVPIWFFNKEKLNETITSQGYSLYTDWDFNMVKIHKSRKKWFSGGAVFKRL